MDVSDAKRLKQLEDENRRLKKSAALPCAAAPRESLQSDELQTVAGGERERAAAR